MGKEKIPGLSIIIASGARPKKLSVAGEDGFRGKGVSYCAVCDAAFFKGIYSVRSTLSRARVCNYSLEKFFLK